MIELNILNYHSTSMGAGGLLEPVVMPPAKTKGGKRICECARLCMGEGSVCMQAPKGNKFERAHVWNVPVVDSRWLDACAAEARPVVVASV